MSYTSNPIPKNTTLDCENRQRALIYIRVSSKEQKDRGYSFQDQEDQARLFCEKRGWEVVGVFSDSDPAQHEHAISRRKGFNAACERALREGIPIVVTSCDRFSRSYPSYQRFEAAGGKLIPVDLLTLSPDPAEIRSRIKDAEAKGAQIARTTRKGIERRRAAGKPMGNPRLAEVRPAGSATIAAKAKKDLEAFAGEVAKARAAGCSNPQAITDYLNDRGELKTASGVPWGLENVKRQLKKMRRAESVPASGAPQPKVEPAGPSSVDKDLISPLLTSPRESKPAGEAIPGGKVDADETASSTDVEAEDTRVETFEEEAVEEGGYSFVRLWKVTRVGDHVLERSEVTDEPSYDERGCEAMPGEPVFGVEAYEPEPGYDEDADPDHHDDNSNLGDHNSGGRKRR